MTLENIGEITTETSQSKGFNVDNIDIPKILCLIHSEVSEALEADREGSHYYGGGDPDSLEMSGYDTIKEYYETDLKGSFEDELADIIIRTCGLAYRLGINLEEFVKLKLEYNKVRPNMHGNKKY